MRRLLAARHVTVLFLPTYSLDFSPIENAFAKLKAFLRQARAQAIEALLEVIARGLERIAPDHAIGFLTNAGLLNLD